MQFLQPPEGWGSLTHAVRLPSNQGFILLSDPVRLSALKLVSVGNDSVDLSLAYKLDADVQASEWVEVFAVGRDGNEATGYVGLPCGLSYTLSLDVSGATLTIMAQGRPGARTIVLKNSAGQTVTIQQHTTPPNVRGTATAPDLVSQLEDPRIKTLSDAARIFGTRASAVT